MNFDFSFKTVGISSGMSPTKTSNRLSTGINFDEMAYVAYYIFVYYDKYILVIASGNLIVPIRFYTEIFFVKQRLSETALMNASL